MRAGISGYKETYHPKTMKILKRTTFGLLAVILCILTVATILEKEHGTLFVTRYIYQSPGFVGIWGVLSILATAYLLRHRFLRPATWLLHLALLIILGGAFITWLTGKQGTLHLRIDEKPVSVYLDNKGQKQQLPFSVTLEKFNIEYYPGTQTPLDFISGITIIDGEHTEHETIAMNRIARYRGYRFYQSSYDSDRAGSRLSVAHDPWGIGITYTGYLLLLLSMIIQLTDRQGTFRRLLQNRNLRGLGLGGVVLLATIYPTHAAEQIPPTLPRNLSHDLGQLCVYYNQRICPISTLAHDFTMKLYGKSSYLGLTAEQVLSGWLFYYDEWKQEPMIKIKSREARQLLGIEGRYARLTDFNRAIRDYRSEHITHRGVSEANEKFSLIAMLCTGSMLQIFPYRLNDTLHWVSQVDILPRELPYEQTVFIEQSMNYINELVAKHNYAELSQVLAKIGQYQQKCCGEAFPSTTRLQAELLYNRMGYSLPLAILLIVIGTAAFLYVCRHITRGNSESSPIQPLLLTGILLGFIYLSIVLLLRGYIARHWPLANGFETMQFMAWCALGITLLSHRRFILVLPFGYLVGGLAMLVSMMGESNPQITPLMPVLTSPLLSVHVVLVMVAYTLLAFVMLNGIAGLVLYQRNPKQAEQLQIVGLILLYPAVFSLAAGIFVGAIWANISWGRYWGWDPKEVWALITWLVYAMALHPVSLPLFKKPSFFHGYCVAAFFCVLITYFGVNFLLGGMHSYA